MTTETHSDGLLRGEPNNTYHSNPAISSSEIKTFLKSKQLYRDTKTGVVKRKQTAAFSFGSAIHAYFLEPADFNNQVAVTPADFNGRTKAGKEWKAEVEASGKVLISQDEMASIRLMSERMPAEIKGTFIEGEAELVARTEYQGLPVQARFDWLNDSIWDIKSTADIEQLARIDCYKFGYFISAAYYERLHEMVTGDHKEFKIIAIEKCAPYRSQVLLLDREMVDYGHEKINEFFAEYPKCVESGNWGDDLPIVRADPVDLPSFIYKQMDEGE